MMKMHQIRFPLGLCPRPRLGSSQLFPYSLAVLRGLILRRKGEECKGKRWETEGEGMGKGRKRERVFPPLQFCFDHLPHTFKNMAQSLNMTSKSHPYTTSNFTKENFTQDIKLSNS